MSADAPEKKTVRPKETGTHAEESEKKSTNATQQVASESNVVPPIHNAHTSKRKKKCWLEWGKFAVEVLTLIVVTVYTGIAYHQWESMRDATTASTTAFRLDQRAWVGVTAATITITNFRVGQQVRAQIWVRNTGKTFALHLTIYQKLISLKTPITKFPEDQSNDAGITLLPGADYAAQVGGGPIPLPVEELQAIKNGREFVYMYGSIGYRDIFGLPHRTQFSMIYNPNTDNFDAYEGHNEAD